MATAAELGSKFTCFKCECKFYDLGAPEPLCPRCGADQREAPAPVAPPRSRRKSTAKKKRAPAKKAAPAPAKPVVEEKSLLDAEGDLLDSPDDAAEK